jgi:hypothetical protein
MYRYITQLVSKARTFLMTHESRRFVPLFTVEALCDRCRYDTGKKTPGGAGTHTIPVPVLGNGLARRGALSKHSPVILLGRHL